jgi:hypothetical protein
MLFMVLMLGMQEQTKAQLSYSYTFVATGTSGWTGNGTRSTNAFCATTASIRYNMYGPSFTSMNFVSPALNSSQGALVTVTYLSKCVLYSPTTTGAAANSVNTKVQYASSTSGPWTDVPNSSFNNTNANTCTSRTVSFTPSSGTFYIRFSSSLINSAADVYLYLDDISITATQNVAMTSLTYSAPA